MTRTDPNVTLSMNCGAVFRPSLASGRFVQTRQLPPERFCSREPWDYAPPAPPAPVPLRPTQAVELLELDE